MAKTGLALNTAIAAAIGGLDGLASSRDANKGRSWSSPGISTSMAPVLNWGWAPVVQISATGVGAFAATQGRSWGTAAMCAGAASFARAAAFKLAQGRSATPIPAQGMVARPASMRPVLQDGGYDNKWDPTNNPHRRNDPGNAFMTTIPGGTDQAYLGGPVDRSTPAPGDSPGNGYVAQGAVISTPGWDPNAMGPVRARGWSGQAGVYGPAQNSVVQHGQAPGLL